MKRIDTFKDCCVAVVADDIAMVIECPAKLEEVLGSGVLQDDCLEEGKRSIPSKRGVYLADIELWFGFEGQPSGGKSDWEFILTNVREAEVIPK